MGLSATSASSFPKTPFFVSLDLLGHSVGGFLPLEAADGDSRIKAVIIVVDFIGFLYQIPVDSSREALVRGVAQQFAAQGMAPMSGATSEALETTKTRHFQVTKRPT